MYRLPPPDNFAKAIQWEQEQQARIKRANELAEYQRQLSKLPTLDQKKRFENEYVSKFKNENISLCKFCHMDIAMRHPEGQDMFVYEFYLHVIQNEKMIDPIVFHRWAHQWCMHREVGKQYANAKYKKNQRDVTEDWIEKKCITCGHLIPTANGQNYVCIRADYVKSRDELGVAHFECIGDIYFCNGCFTENAGENFWK